MGVDKIGSLGKTPGKGSIVKLVDRNNDGKVDSHTEFARLDNPRGILAIGNQVFVLYTTFSEITKLATGMELASVRQNFCRAGGPIMQRMVSEWELTAGSILLWEILVFTMQLTARGRS